MSIQSVIHHLMQRRILQWGRSVDYWKRKWFGAGYRWPRGDNVVAGARRTEELAPLVAQYGERVKPLKLEVRDEAAAKTAVKLAVDTFGGLDVLVNNCRLWAVGSASASVTGA